MKLGSLFDGIGGFPRAAQMCGIEPVWASEIEPFPIEVTKRHFPHMKHLWDVTKIRGNEIEPVDIITFGSPCQDLSVAGKRAGLEGARSGLFYEAVRIIKEMRDATNGRYPTFTVFENVPGALSSNGGKDFVAVYNAFIEIGAVEIGHRVLDARYFGVAQRRRRVFLIADFGKSGRIEQILFEREGLSRHLEESRKAREEVAAGAGASSHIPVWDIGDRRRVLESIDIAPKLLGKMGTGGNNVPILPIQLYDMTHADEVIRPVEPGMCPTLQARMGTGGNQIPVLMQPTYCLQGNMIGRQDHNGPQGSGVNEGVAFTLNATDIHAVAMPYAVRRLTPTECERLQGYPDGWTEGGSDTKRYKAIGNSVAVPVVYWIMRRIKEA